MSILSVDINKVSNKYINRLLKELYMDIQNKRFEYMDIQNKRFE